MIIPDGLPGYDIARSYEDNYRNVPEPVSVEIREIPGSWRYCGKPVRSPLGIPAGPLLNGRWILYYASLGFDILTYKTVRSVERACYPLPNLLPVDCSTLTGDETAVTASSRMAGSWAVSFGMPSRSPAEWRADVERTRSRMEAGKLLVVSVVGTAQEGWTIEQLAEDYARCARWAVESGADIIETNYSCPNVTSRDGQLYQEPSAMEIVSRRVRDAVGQTPFVIKIGHVRTLAETDAVLDAVGTHVDALAMTNSIATRVLDTGGRKLFDGQSRGICGAATREESLRQVARFTQRIAERGLSLSVAGVGGAHREADVRAYLDAGAEVVLMATSAMVDPSAALRIRQEWTRRVAPVQS